MSLRLTNTASSYGWGAIILHWVIAILFIAQFVLGLVMSRVTSQRTS
jgi:cytochrome b561